MHPQRREHDGDYGDAHGDDSAQHNAATNGEVDRIKVPRRLAER